MTLTVRNFCAVDGESFTVNGEHTYVLLASSDGDYIYDREGLQTFKCFEYLLRKTKRTLVAFGLNYDVNMMVRDLDLYSLAALWHNGKCKWYEYTLEWIPGKWFSIRRRKNYVKIHDVFGFFQQSFVKALLSWGIEPQPELTEMKGMRSVFTPSMRPQVIEYCLNECYQLCDLMGRLEYALDDVGLGLSSWVGAGSIASALLRKYGVPDYHLPDSDYPEPVQEVLKHAYFGGRSEVFQQGIFSEVYDYDISSAYPFQATKLPTLTGGNWRHTKSYDRSLPFAVWHARWNLNRDELVMPFPFRRKRDIYYPSRGEGWYHATETAAAQTLTENQIEILEGWVFEPASDTKPFSFIPSIYKERERLKKLNHGGEKVLKLGLNAIYGKLAQGLGYGGKQPPFQSLFWAGMITAATRARILDLAAIKPRRLIMVATDGIFFSEPIDEPLTGGLGGLELTVGNDVLVAQPGVYAFEKDGETIGRSRGFFSSEIDFDLLRKLFLKKGANAIVTYETHRFCGLGYCLLTRNMDHWRTWQDSTRKLSLYPSRKFVHENPYMPRQIRHFPPCFKSGEMSEAYTPKNQEAYSPDDLREVIEYVQGAEQPLRA